MRPVLLMVDIENLSLSIVKYHSSLTYEAAVVNDTGSVLWGDASRTSRTLLKGYQIRSS